ncbi:hypothetical protein IG631_20904 [Alternaria alternata]|jgi:hypothetical protein|nr:hypothetical protein IG631_20904 [Alternaria alternata]
MQKSGRPVPRRGLREGNGGVGIQSQRIRGVQLGPRRQGAGIATFLRPLRPRPWLCPTIRTIARCRFMTV